MSLLSLLCSIVGDSPTDLWRSELWDLQISATQSLCSTAQGPVPSAAISELPSAPALLDLHHFIP